MTTPLSTQVTCTNGHRVAVTVREIGIGIAYLSDFEFSATQRAPTSRDGHVPCSMCGAPWTRDDDATHGIRLHTVEGWWP